MNKPSRCLVIFTKPARPGYVKTRLIGKLTDEQAAELHGAFLEDLLDRMSPGDFETRIAWALGSREATPRSAVEAFRQEGEGLGERLFGGLREMLQRFETVAAVGSDHPELSTEIVEEAFGKLATDCDVVLGPAADGGYYLIGVTRQSIRRGLFREIDWSTSRVLGQTRRRCGELGLRVGELDSMEDVDTPDDLRRLARRIAHGAGQSNSRTRDLLGKWGMIPPLERSEA